MTDSYAELGVKPGQVIADKYRLVKLLGRGGMGSVWRSEHLQLMSQVALKIIKPEIGKNKNSRARFLREAKAAAMLRSPHVVQILEHGTDGEVVYIAMELLEGESLLSRLQRDKQLGPELTLLVFRHMARAMSKAHEAGIIHRDLKPDNVFLVQNDDEIIAKVLDFGIAKSAVWALNSTNDSPQTQTGALLGTPYYMSPEQATGAKDVDHRADLWAMGVIAFECLVGRRPYQSNSLGDLVLQICSRPQPIPSHHRAVPPGFDEWFTKSQSRNPDDRFQSAREMSAALRELLSGGVPTQTRGSLPSATDASAPADDSAAASAPPTTPMPHAAPALQSQPPASTTQDPQSGVPTKATPFEHTARSAAHTLSSNADGSDAPATSAADASVSLQTLDPLSATHIPKRRGWVFGLLGAVAVLALIFGAAWRLGSHDPEPETAAETPAAQVPAAQVPAEQAPAAGDAASSSEATDLQPSADPGSEASSEPSSEAGHEPAATTRPRPAARPRPVARPKPPAPAPRPKPKPRPSTSDPLGI